MELDKIYNEDCIEGMKRIYDGEIDMTITSPPYDNLRTYNNNINNTWNENVWKPIIKELYRITKEGGVVVWIVSDATINGSETGTSFKQALYFKECGFNIHDTMIWYKENCPFPDKTRYYQSFEYMFVMSKGKPKTFKPISDRKNKCGGDSVHGTLRQHDGVLLKPNGIKEDRKIKDYGVRYNMWNIMPCLSNSERTGHPAQFPIKLSKDHIQSWSNENDIILDPFMGSGTTAAAAIQTNRHFIGFELNKEYYNIALNRINEQQLTLNI